MRRLLVTGVVLTSISMLAQLSTPANYAQQRENAPPGTRDGCIIFSGGVYAFRDNSGREGPIQGEPKVLDYYLGYEVRVKEPTSTPDSDLTLPPLRASDVQEVVGSCFVDPNGGLHR
jgi:hypothetical protein